MNTFIFIMLMINFMLPLMNHPLSMTILMIFQSLLICLMMSLMNQSSWFSYILYLSFLGGMLVLFIYMTSLASNELMKFPNILISITSLMLSLTITYFTNNYYYMPHSININQFESPLNLNQLFSFPNFMMTIMMITFLLITLIAVIKISNLNQGTLRHSS